MVSRCTRNSINTQTSMNRVLKQKSSFLTWGAERTEVNPEQRLHVKGKWKLKNQKRPRPWRDQCWTPYRGRAGGGGQCRAGTGRREGCIRRRGWVYLLEMTCTIPVDKPQLCLKAATTSAFSNLTVSHLGIPLKVDSDSVHLGQGPRFCISSKLPSDAAGPWTKLWVTLPSRTAWPMEGREEERGAQENWAQSSPLAFWVSGSSSVNTRKMGPSPRSLSSFKNLEQEGRFIAWRASPVKSGIKGEARAGGNGGLLRSYPSTRQEKELMYLPLSSYPLVPTGMCRQKYKMTCTQGYLLQNNGQV